MISRIKSARASRGVKSDRIRSPLTQSPGRGTPFLYRFVIGLSDIAQRHSCILVLSFRRVHRIQVRSTGLSHFMWPTHTNPHRPCTRAHMRKRLPYLRCDAPHTFTHNSQHMHTRQPYKKSDQKVPSSVRPAHSRRIVTHPEQAKRDTHLVHLTRAQHAHCGVRTL